MGGLSAILLQTYFGTWPTSLLGSAKFRIDFLLGLSSTFVVPWSPAKRDSVDSVDSVVMSTRRLAGESAPHRGLSRPREKPIESHIPPWYTPFLNRATARGTPRTRKDPQ